MLFLIYCYFAIRFTQYNRKDAEFQINFKYFILKHYLCNISHMIYGFHTYKQARSYGVLSSVLPSKERQNGRESVK